MSDLKSEVFKKDVNEDLLKVVSNKIEKLRRKLLDLTRRNPLISANLKDKSGTSIRIVDEVPGFLFNEIMNDEMKILSLPALEEELKDESSREFHNALSEALLNDKIYLQELDGINQGDEKAADQLAKAERNLKDRIREKLKMPARQTKANLSIQQHALNHGINPHYELPLENERHSDGRHADKNIQTLLLPDALERKLNALSLKDREWKEEVGINVLYAGFGFIEWKENNNSDRPCYSPLILLPVELEKRKTRSGHEFWISAEDATPEWNTTLSEKLAHDYGVVLPKYEEGQSVEEYFSQIESQRPQNIDWQLRRWVVIGVFPSAKLAMYHDLDSSNGWNFLGNPITSSLFGGKSDIKLDASAFGDEYNIDAPEIESKIPLIVTDADSSQFSTIVDVVDGKNIAVEGPPGTGKSQTIVNTIAALLSQGKKVMFVAEKSAALEVVKSRLENFGLGNFLLPLQATRSSKEQIISSIRERIEAKHSADPRELDDLKDSFKKTRDELGSYIQILSSVFGSSGYTVHQILGKAIALRKIIDSLPEELQRYNISLAQNISKTDSQEIITLLKALEEDWSEAIKNHSWWKDIGLPNIDPFTANDILKAAQEASQSYYSSSDLRTKLVDYGIDKDESFDILTDIENIAKSLPTNLTSDELMVIENLDCQVALDDVEKFFRDASHLISTKSSLSLNLKNPFAQNAADEIAEIADLIEKNSITNLGSADLKQELSESSSNLLRLKEVLSLLKEVGNFSEDLAKISAKHIINASKVLKNISREAILLRNNNLVDPSAKVEIEKGRKQADNLLKQQEILKSKILISLSIKKDEVTQNILVLNEAGILDILSSKYRKAKKFYGGICLHDKFNKAQALRDLRELENWMCELEELNSNESLKSLLGVRFDSLDTKFDPFFEVFAYFDSIDQNLSHPECFALKNLLRSGNSDLLFSFPKFDHDHPVHSFQDANSESCKALIDALEVELDNLKHAIDRIEKCSENLCDRSGWNSDKLRSIASEVKNFQISWKRLSEDGNIVKLLGQFYSGIETKRENLERGLSISDKLNGHQYRFLLISLLKRNQLDEFCKSLDLILSADKNFNFLLKKISELTKIDFELWEKSKTLQQIADHLENAAKDRDGLISYSNLYRSKLDVEEKGYGDFIKKIFANYSQPCDIAQFYKAILARSSAQEVYRKYGSSFSKFTGIKLSSLRKRLAELDVQIIELSRQKLQAQLYWGARPPEGSKGARKSEYTEMSLLRHEISKTKRYLPMRKITMKAGRALQELKPCWMMSPLAVANYIPKNTLEFDLVIIDEASQMTPENAIGALMRAKQVMVVGDVNQLPPSNFFGKMFEDEEENEDEITTEASILEMASAVFSPRRRLRWHYRSRHSGLIAFSNKYIYDNDLVVFPSANENHAEMGVSYKKVNGLYSTGVNPEEAKAMVDAIVEFMIKYPNKSLGVVVLNQKQAALLSDEMNYAFEKHPLALKYKEKWQDDLEYFFIKNLENVQGDERDVIFIGTVYGPEKEGDPVMQRFGPINGVAGKRRLNVLFSRAKERIVTFSSMNTSDIRAEEETGNPGVYMLKQWLEYSATRIIESGKVANSGDTDSEFEDHVIQQLKSIGCYATPQVGVVGYSIDIGVKHPDWPHGFIMGVECDGATYHSSKSARDRDRLRQKVLEGLGWNLYRIWSTDWFNDPVRETEKLREAVRARMIQLKESNIC